MNLAISSGVGAGSLPRNVMPDKWDLSSRFINLLLLLSTFGFSVVAHISGICVAHFSQALSAEFQRV
jgi:hypothetical protein